MRCRTLSAQLFVLLVTAACGGGPTGNKNQPGTANFSALIDGAPWNSITLSTSVTGQASGTFALVGSNSVVSSPLSISLILYNIGEPGIYPLGVAGTMRGGTATLTQGVSSWSTPQTGSAGKVEVTSVSATRIAGKFNFVAEPFSGSSTGNRDVKSGTFDLPVTSSGSVAVPDKNGSTITGTLDNTPWNPATVAMVVAPTSGTFTFGLSNTTHNINVIVSGFTGIGTYTMNTGVSRNVTVTTFVGGAKTWGGTGARTSGSLIVTSSTATRIKGSLNVSLQPGIASPGPGTITFSSNFDIGIPQ